MSVEIAKRIPILVFDVSLSQRNLHFSGPSLPRPMSIVVCCNRLASIFLVGNEYYKVMQAG